MAAVLSGEIGFRGSKTLVLSRWINTRWYNVTTLEILGSKFSTPLTMRLIFSFFSLFFFFFSFPFLHLELFARYLCKVILYIRVLQGTTLLLLLLLLFFTF